jgi:hypothetical protein
MQFALDDMPGGLAAGLSLSRAILVSSLSFLDPCAGRAAKLFAQYTCEKEANKDVR